MLHGEQAVTTCEIGGQGCDAPQGSILIKDEWLDQFILEGMVFKKYQLKPGMARFAQVIHEGNITCLYYWKKRYSLDSQVGERSYHFSDPIRQSYLVINGELLPYQRRRSFLKCFPVHHRQSIKVYMKINGIRISKSADPAIQSLIGYIDQHLMAPIL